MNGTKKTLLALALTVLVGITSAGGALASSYYPIEVSTLSGYLDSNSVSYKNYSGSLWGNYWVTPVAYEAGDTISLKNWAGTTLFTNKNMDTEAGSWKTTDLAWSYFYDQTTGKTTWLVDGFKVPVYQLTKDWTLSSGLTLSSGTLILGLNDKGSSDCDFDDFILAASKTAPTPVPAAVWLLGSGLLGVMGFNRTRNNKA